MMDEHEKKKKKKKKKKEEIKIRHEGGCALWFATSIRIRRHSISCCIEERVSFGFNSMN